MLCFSFFSCDLVFGFCLVRDIPKGWGEDEDGDRGGWGFGGGGKGVLFFLYHFSLVLVD